jgi:hypothetical protein
MSERVTKRNLGQASRNAFAQKYPTYPSLSKEHQELLEKRIVHFQNFIGRFPEDHPVQQVVLKQFDTRGRPLDPEFILACHFEDVNIAAGTLGACIDQDFQPLAVVHNQKIFPRTTRI